MPGGGPSAGVVYPGYKDAPTYYAAVSADGLYTVMVIDYEGDTRANPWYCHIIALANDPTYQTVQGAMRDPLS